MPKDRKKQVFRDCIMSYKVTAILAVLSLTLLLMVFLLYRLSLEPLLYAAVLMIVVIAAAFGLSYAKALKESERRFYDFKGFPENRPALPEAGSQIEADYLAVVASLGAAIDRIEASSARERTEMLDYFTAWVHQIKTPIAVMHLRLAEEDTEKNRALASELFRIEQYVDMVLQYIRLGSETNDLVIKEYKLDELIRQSVRKYASQIIGRKLSLHYEPTDKTIVTDRKWFAVILEQLLSNAVKYTPSGGISIRVLDNNILEIEDTSIGIAASDLPRIFEKGYTGGNGRDNEKSSGLGLYLCKKAADKINIGLTVESSSGKGTVFRLAFNDRENGPAH